MRPIPGLGNYQGQRFKKIDVKTTVAGGSVVFDLPQDLVIKELLFIHDMNISCTFAATKPVVHPRGVSHGLINSLEVARSGNDVIKSFRGLAQLQDQAQWLYGEPCPTLFAVNSTTLTSENYGLPTFGTTTQTTAVREIWSVPFENKLSSEFVRTCLNLSGVNTAKVRLSLGAASQMQDPNDVANVGTFTYSGTITLYAITADHLGDVLFDDWKQGYDEGIFSTLVNGSTLEFRPLGLLQGMYLRAFKGNGYKPLTPEEMKAFSIEVKFNDNLLFEGTMADFQALNGAKNDMQRFLRSAAYLNCLNNSTFDTGLETGQDAKSVTPLRFKISTPSSINHSTDPVRLVVDYDLIVRRR